LLAGLDRIALGPTRLFTGIRTPVPWIDGLWSLIVGNGRAGGNAVWTALPVIPLLRPKIDAQRGALVAAFCRAWTSIRVP